MAASSGNTCRKLSGLPESRPNSDRSFSEASVSKSTCPPVCSCSQRSILSLRVSAGMEPANTKPCVMGELLATSLHIHSSRSQIPVMQATKDNNSSIGGSNKTAISNSHRNYDTTHNLCPFCRERNKYTRYFYLKMVGALPSSDLASPRCKVFKIL